jgi:hypothetical protein
MRATFKAELPLAVERDLEAEANMEAIRRKLYAASYAAGGQDWHKLFQSVDKDKSGELGFPEFRTAVRKGAKLSPTVVSDNALRVLFKAVDMDGSVSRAIICNISARHICPFDCTHVLLRSACFI